MRKPRPWLWLLPLALTCDEALAWGLYTHVYFGQFLLWAVPLADPAMRRAVRRFPRLVLAGACLPDLSLLAKFGAGACFADTHDWACAGRLLKSAREDEDRALALGFAAHLLCDVIAHNHFVPGHENLWFDLPHVTHALCEWAMDRHIAPQLSATPHELLSQDRARLAPWVAENFHCTAALAQKSLWRLARADRLLRRSRLPCAIFATARAGDRRMARRFDHFLAHTARSLGQINRLLDGIRPPWDADVCPRRAKAGLAGVSLDQMRLYPPLPADLYGCV